MPSNPHLPVLASLAAIAITGASLSCSSGSPTPPATVTPSSTSSSAPVSFRSQVQPIFTANCSVSGCHTGSSVSQSGGMDLTAGVALTNIKDVISPGYSPLKRVVSGDAERSVLFAKIANTGTIDGKFIGDRMPLSRPALSASEIATIQVWINQGALDN